MECKYSLIIPVYQVREYIEQCLDSIFCQIPQDVQVILVDDGSTDGSGEICDEYAKRYPQIEVIHQENKGVAAARNAGLDAAKGEYLLWVDPDDWVSDNWFSEINGVIQNRKPDVIFFDSMRIGDGKEKKEVYGRTQGFIEKKVFCEDIARDIRMLSGMPNKVIRREFFFDVRFDTELRILEDYDAIFAILEKAETYFYISHILYFYRQNANSLLHSYSPEKSFKCVQIAIERKNRIDPRFRNAAIVGVAIQAFLFCRASAYDSRFSNKSDAYLACKRVIHRNMKVILYDQEVPVKWKLKFILLDMGAIHSLLKLKMLFKRGIS